MMYSYAEVFQKPTGIGTLGQQQAEYLSNAKDIMPTNILRSCRDTRKKINIVDIKTVRARMQLHKTSTLP